MWIVAKHNYNEFNILLKELEKKIGRKIKFYRPKILISNLPQKYRYILSDYAFFYNETFINTRFIRQLKNTKGLKYFLNFYQKDQSSIQDFINFCKKHEDKNENLMNSFFENSNFNKIRLLNGPFKNFIFSIVDHTSKNLRLNMGKLKLTLDRKKNSTAFVF
tara:strand:+ start:2915 stop:3400 length:486 start_codon:yes stop_codon:yes gene_type:complete